MKVFNKIKARIRKKLTEAVQFEINRIKKENTKPWKIYTGFKEIGPNSFFWGDQHFISGIENLSIGENVHIGNNAFIRAEGGLIIGDNTHISRNLVLYSINHDYTGNVLPYDEKMIHKKVSIGRNVWIGMNVCIAPGTVIGDGCIIGMGTTVSGNISPMSIVASPKCVIIKERDRNHYNYLDEIKRYGGPNGQLYNWGHNNLLKKVGDSFLARRSSSTLIEFQNQKAIKKEFLQTKDGKEAFQREKNALIQFQNFNWCPKILDIDENSITIEYFDNTLRLDQQAVFSNELLGEILWSLFELFEQGYVHMDFHARNIFVTDNGVKFIDFETTKELIADVDFWDSYDITGKGMESPYITSNMGIMNKASTSLSQLFHINSLDELKTILDTQFQKRMYDSSITFRTLRDGKERHFLNNPRIYASFDLLHTKVKPANSQRNTFKRFQRFGIEKEIIENKTILDIGSNIGATLLNLYNYNPRFMTGLEFDVNKVDISKKLARYNGIKNVLFQQFDIEVDELNNQNFEIVFCLAVIEHLRNKNRLFELLGEVTKHILYFEGNANSDIEFIIENLKSIAGFNDVQFLGFSDDEANEKNNCRPLFIAKK